MGMLFGQDPTYEYLRRVRVAPRGGNDQIVFPAGIASEEAFGTPTVTPGQADVLPSGIPSGEVFGTATLVHTVTPTGIPSGEAFGTPTVAPFGALAPVGIASVEAFGTPTVTPGQVTIAPAGIASTEVFGSTSVVYLVQPGGIASAGAFGTAALVVGGIGVTPSGIASEEAFGTPALVYLIAPAGIVSAEGVGAVSVVYLVQPTGIGTAEVFGAAVLFPGQVVIAPTGIGSAEGVGTPSLTVSVDPARLTGRTQSRRAGAYELIAVARIPQQYGPPTLIDVDPIEWSGLSWADELLKPQRLDASVRITSLTASVVERLRNLATQPLELWLYRDGTLVFAGPWTTWLTQGETMTITAVGLLGYLRYREVRSDRTFAQGDQLEIVKTLVDDTQARAYGHFGIDTSGVTPSGVLRDARYLVVERHNLAQRIEEMGRRANGFDVEVDPATRRLLLWSPTKGADRSVGEDAIVFDARNVTDPTVSCSVAPGDVATDTLAVGTSDMATVIGIAGNDELRTKFGVADYTESFDGVSEQGTIDGHALGILDPRDQALLIPGPDVRSTPDADISSYAAGDTVAYQLHDSLSVRGAFRVRKRTVRVSETGEEKVALEFV